MDYFGQAILKGIHRGFSVNQRARIIVYGLSAVLLAFMVTTEGAAVLGWFFGGIIQLVCLYLIAVYMLVPSPEETQTPSSEQTMNVLRGLSGMMARTTSSDPIEVLDELVKDFQQIRKPLSDEELASYVSAASQE